MAIRLGINGFGRIGRTVTRILQSHPAIELVAINDLASIEQLAHALKYDSVYHKFPGEVEVNGTSLSINGRNVRLTATRDIPQIDWSDVDIVIEATGKFRKRAEIESHLQAGAKKVVLAVPPKDSLDATIVLGVNDHELRAEHRMVSNASCTTNAAAPVTAVIHENFGVKRGYLNTIHAYTNDQRLIDFPHADFRRSRAAAVSIIPSTTGAAKAVGQVIPALNGKLDGTSYRVPVQDGSIVDMLFEVEKPVTVELVNAALKEACAGRLLGIVEYCTDPIVSSDIIGNAHSGVFDAGLTQVIDGCMVKVAVWYDNEFGYSCRLVDMVNKLHAL